MTGAAARRAVTGGRRCGMCRVVLLMPTPIGTRPFGLKPKTSWKYLSSYGPLGPLLRGHPADAPDRGGHAALAPTRRLRRPARRACRADGASPRHESDRRAIR